MKTVKIIKKHIDPNVFWKMDQSEQVKVLKCLLFDLCQLYRLPNVKLEFINDAYAYKVTGGGIYIPDKNKIMLFKISLMTFLHEFAHIFFKDERRAQLWSHKAFYYSFPKLYLRNVKEKKFFHYFDLKEIQRFNECFK